MRARSLPRRARAAGLSFALALALVAGAAAPARADGGPFGLGLVIGSPTGLSAKYYLNRTNAIDAALGGAFLGANGIELHATYLWLPWVLAREAAFDLGLYLGVGGRLLEHDRKDFDDDLHVGVRGPVGILFDFGQGGVPIDVFAEVALVVDLFVVGDEGGDHDHVDLNAGIGIRYYF